jgi:hypothetical protein
MAHLWKLLAAHFILSIAAAAANSATIERTYYLPTALGGPKSGWAWAIEQYPIEPFTPAPGDTLILHLRFDRPLLIHDLSPSDVEMILVNLDSGASTQGGVDAQSSGTFTFTGASGAVPPTNMVWGTTGGGWGIGAQLFGDITTGAFTFTGLDVVWNLSSLNFVPPMTAFRYIWVTFNADRVGLAESPNLPPVAVAGNTQSIHAGATVQLNGSGSYDDNTPSAQLGYAWSLFSRPTGSTATLTNALASTASFVADKSGSYVVQLVVTDTGSPPLQSSPGYVTISSVNQPPTASAGPDQVAVVFYPVSLNGSGSRDPEGDPMTYAWAITTAPAGSLAPLSGPTSSTPNFTPDVPGTYTVTLNVSDPYGPGTADAVVITAGTASDYVVQKIACATNIIGGLSPNQVTNQGNKTALLKLLGNAVAAKQGDHQHSDDGEDGKGGDESPDRFNVRMALKKLSQAITRTDGCALRGIPDGNGKERDWITDCAAQLPVYACLKEVDRVLRIVP